ANVPPKGCRALIDRRPPVPDDARDMASNLIRQINRERARCMHGQRPPWRATGASLHGLLQHHFWEYQSVAALREIDRRAKHASMFGNIARRGMFEVYRRGNPLGPS